MQTVEVDSPCPACEAGADEPRLRARMDELEGVLHQHMAEQAFEQWSAGHEVRVMLWNDAEVIGVEALHKHITYLESLLLCGFTILDQDDFDLMQHSDRPEAGSSASGSGIVRPVSEVTMIHSPSEAPALPRAQQPQSAPAQSEAESSISQTVPPAQSGVEDSSSQAAPAARQRFTLLRGVSAIRREFIPGVEWASSKLSRKETARRRAEFRRGRGNGGT